MTLAERRAFAARMTRWAGALLLCALGCLGIARADVLELTQASATITPEGSASSTQQLQLPYHWDRRNPGLRGHAEFELSFTLAQVPDQPWALLLPRLGNAYEVWLNGMLLQHQGDLAHYNGPDYALAPHYLVISPGLLRASNVLRVHIRADLGRRGGLSTLQIGPADEVESAYRRRLPLASGGTAAVAAFSLLIGLMALALWTTQNVNHGRGLPGRDPVYLHAALAELFWGVGLGSVALHESPLLPWPWWGMVPLVAGALWLRNLLLFCAHLAGWGDEKALGRFAHWLTALAVAAVVLPWWALARGQPWLLTVWFAAAAGTALLFGLVFIAKAVRRPLPGQRVVAVALLLNALVGLWDVHATRVSTAYGLDPLVRFSSMLFGLSLAYVVIMRFRAVSAQAGELLTTLAARVAQKEAELAHGYRELEQMARAQERAAERTRILRDMHDGVGAHISSAIHQLQSGRASREHVLLTLRDSLDQLKLSIDAMHVAPGDVTALLANLRYRLEPRFTATGITLHWAVDALPLLPRLDAAAMRQLQYMLFEALSNVLQHAQASALRVQAQAVNGTAGTRADALNLRVVDNGRGFDATQPGRRGLAAMQARAGAIGARLHISSQPGETVVEMVLPAA